MTRWAIVTGASGGLGEQFARKIAASGENLLLTGRNTEKLSWLANQLPVETKVSVVDLADSKQADLFVSEVEKLDVSILVNNAGFGTIDSFVDMDPSRMQHEIDVDVLMLTRLTRAVLPGMVARGSGKIINVASTAAFQPIPRMSVYAGAKSYVLSFTQAIWREVQGSGVQVSAICPGPTRTGFFDRAGSPGALKMLGRRKPEQVVETAFVGLAKNRPYMIDGWRNKLLAFATRFCPPKLLTILSNRMLGD